MDNTPATTAPVATEPQPLSLDMIGLYNPLTPEVLAETMKDEKQLLENINKLIEERNMFLQDSLNGLLIMVKVTGIIDFEAIPKNKFKAMAFIGSNLSSMFDAIEKDLPGMLPVLNQLKNKYSNVLAEIKAQQTLKELAK